MVLLSRCVQSTFVWSLTSEVSTDVNLLIQLHCCAFRGLLCNRNVLLYAAYGLPSAMIQELTDRVRLPAVHTPLLVDFLEHHGVNADLPSIHLQTQYLLATGQHVDRVALVVWQAIFKGEGPLNM